MLEEIMRFKALDDWLRVPALTELSLSGLETQVTDGTGSK